MPESLIGAVEDLVGGAIGLVRNIDLGKENVNQFFSNLTLLSLLLTSLKENDVKETTSIDNEYDYIVVGGGTAGSIMASRLSQHLCVKVLLIEAGGKQAKLSEVPGLTRLMLGTPMDWSYLTVPQKGCAFGQNENRVLWNSGRVIGGSSAINSMLHVRGNKENYNQWAREGALGWSYNEVLKYFIKLEDNRNLPELDQGYHRKGGPIGVERPRYTPEIKQPVLKALLDMGYPLRDINGARQIGIYDVQGTVRHQERCSTAKGYLKPACHRQNLHILLNAFVHKIIINRRFKSAWGVMFEHEGKMHTVHARKEVIISNGATRTPQLLMLSGIGPKEILDKFQIPAFAYLPVGKNLQDHIAGNLLYTVDDSIPSLSVKLIDPVNILKYIILREGPVASTSQNVLIAFLDGMNTTANSRDFPMQEVYIQEYSPIDGFKNVNLKKKVIDWAYAPYLFKPLYQCQSQLLQPYSRGEITINSTDPKEYPLINPNYYSDKRDLDNVVKGLKICQAIANHPAMKKLKAEWIPEQKHGYPGCQKFEADEDEHLGCLARSVVNTFWHPSGTARMGHPNDPRSVVDPELRVLGINKLRVVNAAIMPTIPSANTNVPTMMIAEKAYDIIKPTIGCPSAVTIYQDHEVPDTGSEF